MKERPLDKCLQWKPIVGKCGVCGKKIDSRKANATIWVVGSELACSQAHADKLTYPQGKPA
jgi:hypothetical protein